MFVPQSPLALLDTEPGDIRVRTIGSLEHFHACADLQAEVWGREFSERVPSTLLQVATYVGGIVFGAFTAGDELVGFLFGLTGVQGAEVVHWSHLLGVRDSARNQGVGRLLKEAQRNELAKRGVRRMLWSFDPLVAKNAYLNLNRLGARVVEYVPNMYGTTTSPLHYGIATDRLIVSIDTSADAPSSNSVDTQPGKLPVLTPAPQDGDVSLEDTSPPPALWIEIPSDIRQVIEQSPPSAIVWREAVRTHFQWALMRGYVVVALHRDPVTSRSYFLLHREEAA